MKKIVIIFGIIIVSLILIISVSLIENSKNLSNIKAYNKQYEEYYQKTVYGTDVMTLINRATDQNLRNEIEKDEKGYFIENDINSIKLEIKLLSEEKLLTYQMETLMNVGLEGFVKNFNLIKFKCTQIEYHNSTKKIKKIVFEQIEE